MPQQVDLDMRGGTGLADKKEGAVANLYRHSPTASNYCRYHNVRLKAETRLNFCSIQNPLPPSTKT